MRAELKPIVEDLILNKKMNDPEVAARTGLNVQAVRRYRVQTLGVKKTIKGEMPEIVTPEGKVTVKQELKPLTQEDKEVKYKFYLKQSPRYSRLEKMLTKQALAEFVESWATMKASIEDLTPAEEDNLEILLLYKIRIDDNQRSLKEAHSQEDKIRESIGNRELDLENEIDRAYNEMINANNRYKTELNRDLKELTDKYLLLQKSLNQTREQREAKQKVGADTFLTLVRKFKEVKEREAMGKYNELMKLATKKKETEFKEGHEFVDKSIEPILLDGSDFVNKKDKGE